MRRKTPAGSRLAGLPAPVFWVLVAGLAFGAAFVLPFGFPLREPVMSPAYTAGANNRVAAEAIALLSGLVALVCWASARPPEAPIDPDQDAGLSRGWLLGLMTITLLFTAVMGWFFVRARLYLEDGSYFLTQLRTGLSLHREIYRGFEFPYGPALYLWPAGVARALGMVGVSLSVAYLPALAAMQAAGLAMLFYLVNRLPLRHGLRRVAFVLLWAGSLQPLLGMNYTLFRFTLPLVAAVALTRQAGVWRAAAWAFMAEVLCLAASPELGVGFGGAALAYGVYRALPAEWVAASHPQTGWRPAWLLVGAAALAGAVGFVACMLGAIGRDYLLTMGEIAKGGFNLILEPLPHTLLLLVAAVALAPLVVGRAVRRDEAAAGTLLAVYVASLGLLPAAFGRSDALHVFYNGLGLFLLGFVAVGRLGGRPGPQREAGAGPAVGTRLWVTAIGLLVGFAVLQNYHFYRLELANLLRGPEAVTDDTGVDREALVRALGGKTVEIPGNPSWALREDLIAAGAYRPGYFVGLLGVWDRESEQRVIGEMRAGSFALLPSGEFAGTEQIDNTPVKVLMRFGYRYRARRAPYIAGLLMKQELSEHWRPVGVFGIYTLWRRES